MADGRHCQNRARGAEATGCTLRSVSAAWEQGHAIEERANNGYGVRRNSKRRDVWRLCREARAQGGD